MTKMNTKANTSIPPICDFKKYERLSPEVLEGFSVLQKHYNQQFNHFLSENWEGEVSCQTLPLQQNNPEQFIKSLPSPTVIAHIDISPYYRPLLVTLDASVARMAICNMLKQPVPDHNQHFILNALERALILKFIRHLLDLLNNCLEKIPMTFTIRHLSYNDGTQYQLKKHRIYLVCPILIEAPTNGMIHLALPFNNLHELQNLLPHQEIGKDPRAQTLIEKLPVEIRAVLATTKISSEDLHSLEPGDLLLFQQEASTHVELKVKNITIGEGEAGLVGQHKGVQL